MPRHSGPIRFHSGPPHVHEPSALARFEFIAQTLETDPRRGLPAVKRQDDIGDRLGWLRRIAVDVRDTEKKIDRHIDENVRRSRFRGYVAGVAAGAALAAGGLAGFAATASLAWLAPVVPVALATPAAARMLSRFMTVRAQMKHMKLYMPVRNRLAAVRQQAREQTDAIMSPKNAIRLAYSPRAAELSDTYPDIRKHFADAFIGLARKLAPVRGPATPKAANSNDTPPLGTRVRNRGGPE